MFADLLLKLHCYQARWCSGSSILGLGLRKAFDLTPCSVVSLAISFLGLRSAGTKILLSRTVSNIFSQNDSYKLAAIKLVTPSKEHLEKHYEDLSDKPFFKGLVTCESVHWFCCPVHEADN